MKNLLFKEYKLAMHPTTYLFLAVGLLLLIPGYIYYVAFIYTCLSIFFVFLAARENKDTFYTVSLPVPKRDTVKARCLFVGLIEGAQTLLAVPFAIIGIQINPNPAGNPAGIEANPAFFGLVLILYALFNWIFLTQFYKTGFKLGLPLTWASITVGVYVTAVEVAVQLIPFLKTRLDTTAPEMLPIQLSILVLGLLIYSFGLWATYRKAAALFEKVDL